MKVLSDVWKLESDLQEQAAIHLGEIVELAFSGSRKAQNYLKKLWNNDWQTIKERLNTEGSVWYVWWMDGVNQHLANILWNEQERAKDGLFTY